MDNLKTITKTTLTVKYSNELRSYTFEQQLIHYLKNYIKPLKLRSNRTISISRDGVPVRIKELVALEPQYRSDLASISQTNHSNYIVYDEIMKRRIEKRRFSMSIVEVITGDPFNIIGLHTEKEKLKSDIINEELTYAGIDNTELENIISNEALETVIDSEASQYVAIDDKTLQNVNGEWVFPYAAIDNEELQSNFGNMNVKNAIDKAKLPYTSIGDDELQITLKEQVCIDRYFIQLNNYFSDIFTEL